MEFLLIVVVLFVLFVIALGREANRERDERNAHDKKWHDKWLADQASLKKVLDECATRLASQPESWFIEAGWEGGRAQYERGKKRDEKERKNRYFG